MVGSYRCMLKIANIENDKTVEVFLPVTTDTLNKTIGINDFDDKNLRILECGRSCGQNIQKILNAHIQNKSITMRQINEVGKVLSRYDIDQAITMCAFVEVGKIKSWYDILKMDAEVDKYQVIFYDSELKKERLGNYIYNEFQHRKPIYERSKEYKEKLVDDFHKYAGGNFTKFGYLVKDFEKINARLA